jgi:hypothetical protein
MIEYVIVGSVVNFGAGVALSLTDKAYSINAKKRTEERLGAKLKQVEALDFLARTPETNTPEYARNVILARDYFAEKGIKVNAKSEKGKWDRFTDMISFYKTHERLNNLGWKPKLAIAYGANLAVDCAVLATAGAAAGPALLATSYEGLCLFAGLQVGKLFRSRTPEEKQLEKVARDLTQDGKILSIATHYSPTANLKVPEENSEQGTEKTAERKPMDYNQIGTKAGTVIADAAGKAGNVVNSGIAAIRKSLEDKRKARETERNAKEAERRKPFNDLINRY